MTQAELKVFRRTLEDQQAELGPGSGNREALAIETSSDELDRIQNAGDREYAMRTMERNSTRLREVREALRRMDSDMFGICIGCDETINPKRLAAVPWASYCINCQEAADRAKTSENEFDLSIDLAA